MKTFLLLLVSSISFSQSQDYIEGTNPLPNQLPKSISEPNNRIQKSEASEAFDRSMKYLNKEKQVENPTPVKKMSFQEAMNTLNDDKFNFEEHNVKPEQVYNELPSGELELKKSEPYIQATYQENQKTENEALKYFGMAFGLLCVFVTFITLLFSKRTKRF